MSIEEVIVRSRATATEEHYAVIDRVQRSSTRRAVRRGFAVAALVIAGCAAHPDIRSFSVKVLSLPSRSTQITNSDGDLVESHTTYSAIITNAPAPAYLPEGYSITRDNTIAPSLLEQDANETTLVWHRSTDGAVIAVSWSYDEDDIEAFDEQWKSARSNPALDRVRLADRRRGFLRTIPVAMVSQPAIEARWKTHLGVISLLATHETPEEVMRIANSVQ